MKHITDWLLGLHGLPVYALVGALVFAEDALFVGFVIPGETAAIIGGVAASLGHASLPIMYAVVILAAILGDTVGYEIGRHLGTRVLQSRALSGRTQRLESARDLLARRGGTAVFLGRFVAFFRATMPALAGTAEMRYRKFLAYNAAGGIIWGSACVTIGYLAGTSYARVAQTFGRDTALAAAAIVVVVIIVWRVRKHRAERAKDAAEESSEENAKEEAPDSVQGD